MAFAMLMSCSDDAKINTGNASVAFAETEVSVKESKGIFTVPVVVTGEQNGPIEVTVSVSSNDANCKEDVHYMITSKNIIIPEDKKQVNIEIKTIDDRIINDDRHFSLHIENANGATIGTTGATANVTLIDNDNIPYERMAGTWTVSAINLLTESGNEPISWDINLSVVDDTDPSYGSAIISSPWAIFDGSLPEFEDGQRLIHSMTFYHNESTGKTTVDMKMGSMMASNLNFGMDGNVDLTNASIRSATESMTGLSYSGTITGVVNDTFDEVVFSSPLYIIVFNTNGNPYMYYGGFDKITLKLKK